MKCDLFTLRKKVAEKIAPFLRRSAAVKGQITATASIGIRRIAAMALSARSLICFESCENDRTQPSRYPASRASFDEKNLLARKYPRRIDKTKLNASTLAIYIRSISGADIYTVCRMYVRRHIHVPRPWIHAVDVGCVVLSEISP